MTIGEPILSGLAGHLDRYLAVYPISRSQEVEGLALINWVARVSAADGQPMPPRTETTPRVDDVLEARGRACGRRAMGLSLDNIVVNRQMVGQQVSYRGPILEFEAAWTRADFAPLTTCLQANAQVSGQF